MKYPAELTSTIMDSEVAIVDADGRSVLRASGFVVFEGAHRSPVYKMGVEKLLATSPVFHFSNLNGEVVHSVRRNNFVSLFESWCLVLTGDEVKLKIREGKALGKIFGGLFDGTPLEYVSSRVWNPAFVVLRSDNTKIMTLDKRRSFVGRRYTIRKHVDLANDEERLALLGLFGLIFFEDMYQSRLW